MNAEHILTEHRRLLEGMDRPYEVQRELLTTILERNAHTAFGREHGLEAVRSVEDLSRAVPICTHEEMMPWIERTMDGERNVLAADDPVVYFSSSGTTGHEKHIPVTRTYVENTFLPFLHAAFAPLLLTLPQALAVPEAVLNLWQDPTAPIGHTPKGRPHIGASQVDYREFGAASALGPGSGATWDGIPEELVSATPWDRGYYKLRLAAEQDIRLLICVNPAIAAALPYQLGLLWPRLVEDIAKGTLDGRPHTAPNPRRAKEIECHARTFGTVHPYHLWPRLSAVFVWNSALASLYLPRVREMYGPGVQLVSAPVASCEGPVAVPVDLSPGAPLYLPGCVYEFVPADGPLRADSETLSAGELEENQDYHVVFSHVGGLYRCAVNDVVRVVGRVGRTPRVEYAGRNIVRSAAGEALTEGAALRALRAACQDTGAEIRNATYYLDSKETGHGGRYRIAVAFAGPPTRSLATALDTRLSEQCEGYRAGRRSGLMEPLDMVVVHRDAFQREWERAVRAGQRPPRVKDRVFEPSEEVWNRITAQKPEITVA